ncbi:hypothetical protein UFOVP449_121 [uncultured Caudovirales phage]|uniref:Uncharacterized protein n=1 Tax=uncultured Caudovirales phage TaxID=2100421 RepID=A0A6J5M8W8_9CAUD|nr:hypothetical protein UFOVP449_121 [uncultured Caudovirales phage]
MAKTIMELFKERQPDIYGVSATVLIESRGIINPPRQAALALASPNTVADLVGSTGAQLIGGNANRPSDTIFKDNTPLSKPISIVPTVAQLRNAVEAGQTYFVKTEPSPGTNIAFVAKNAIQSPAAAQTAAIQLVNKIGSKSAVKDVKDYYNLLKTVKNGLTYGPAKGIDSNGQVRSVDYKYSTHYPIYEEKTDENGKSFGFKTLKERPASQNWDIINAQVLSAAAFTGSAEYGDQLNKIDENNKSLQQTFVKFRVYGKTNNRDNDIVLPGTISGISEDFSPEWNTFKYVGSPFNLYRYGGVERTLKFDVKMYYLDVTTKNGMINNLNRLRKLVFPDEDINVVTYPGDTKRVSQLFFAPNLVYLTINGIYENILGIVDSLSFSIDDNTSWATTSPNIAGNVNDSLYPTVINVSLGMKIIEHPAIKGGKILYGENNEGTNRYVNYFTNKIL